MLLGKIGKELWQDYHDAYFRCDRFATLNLPDILSVAEPGEEDDADLL